jgi:hypothetical protein
VHASDRHAVLLFSSAAVQMPCWSEFDVTELARALNGRPLAAVSKAALKKLGLMGNLDPLRLHCFLVDLESRYHHQNSYHCSTHAADVVQGVFVFIVEVSYCLAWCACALFQRK